LIAGTPQCVVAAHAHAMAALNEVLVDDDPSRTLSYRTAVVTQPSAPPKRGDDAANGDIAASTKGTAADVPKKDGEEMATFNELWRYASKRDRALFWVACTCSLVQVSQTACSKQAARVHPRGAQRTLGGSLAPLNSFVS
jgi:hypothetical protein